MPTDSPKQETTLKSMLGSGVILVVIVLIAALVLRIVQTAKSSDQPPLLTQSEGLIRLTNPDEISVHTSTPIALPTKTFNAQLHIIGVYPNEDESFPAGTVALVYVRDGYRFVEVSFRPGLSVEKERSFFQGRPEEIVLLNKTTEAILLRLRDDAFCKKSNEDVTGVCQISRALMFEQNGSLVTIFADGRHPTDGELIEIARSIVDASNAK